MAHAWGISPTKTTQARDPAFRKVAKALLLYPAETTAELARFVAEAEAERYEETVAMLPQLRARQIGRQDATTIH